MEIVKNSKNLGKVVMKEVDYQLAKDMIIKNHYSHKWNGAFGKINIGIFKDDRLLGVAVFGSMMNSGSFKNITDYGRDSLIELNRLWIDDELGYNAETILLGACWKIIRALYPEIKFVQSFADGRLGCGTIYKASNFKYYGYHTTLFYEDRFTGEVHHKVSLENTKRPSSFLLKNADYLDGRLRPFYVKTYRYIYPLYKKIDVKLEQEEYPPYDKGVHYVDDKQTDLLLGRLYKMYDFIGAADYAKLALEAMETKNKEEVSKILKRAEDNKSVQWFKNEYNSRDKILEELNKKH